MVKEGEGTGRVVGGGERAVNHTTGESKADCSPCRLLTRCRSRWSSRYEPPDGGCDKLIRSLNLITNLTKGNKLRIVIHEPRRSWQKTEKCDHSCFQTSIKTRMHMRGSPFVLPVRFFFAVCCDSQSSMSSDNTQTKKRKGRHGEVA